MQKQFQSFYFILFLFSPFALFSQNSELPDFQVNGSVNIDTGTVIFEMGREKMLYPVGFHSIIAKIENGKFSMSGKLPYPVWGVFRIGKKYVSSNTPLESGNQDISLNINSNYETPLNGNSIAKEIPKYETFFANATTLDIRYRRRYDSLTTVYSDKIPEDILLTLYRERKKSFDSNDSTLVEYIKINPNSYYALFRLYHLIGFGYNNTLGLAYDNFTDLLKNSPQGKALYQKIAIGKLISVGAIIPTLNSVDNNGKKIDSKPYSAHKYTLIDFWYSSCAPCIAQFPDLAKTRNEFLNKGFEIISISIDKEKLRKEWQEAIIRHNMSWPQYLDFNSVDAKKLNIDRYPTNFLVDRTGKILVINILPAELKEFLRENLN